MIYSFGYDVQIAFSKGRVFTLFAVYCLTSQGHDGSKIVATDYQVECKYVLNDGPLYRNPWGWTSGWEGGCCTMLSEPLQPTSSGNY